jgi:predicted DNA-binding transcriptional regulator YafY
MESSDGWNIELERIQDGKTKYLRYVDDNFSILGMPLNELEITQLKEALNVFRQFEGMPQFEWMEEVIAKLQQDLRVEKKGTLMAFDSNRYLVGSEYIGQIYNAIQYQKVLKIQYRTFHAQERIEMILHPYFLKQFNNRWFAFGHNPQFESVSTVALDRIESLEEVLLPYQTNTKIDFEDYFDDIIGVTKRKNALPQKVELLVSEERAGYVITKPLHGSQKKIRLDEDGLLISLDVIINPELKQLILSFGNQIKVLAPVELQEEIKENHRKALQQY